jgi:hypothetical protein
MIVTCSTLLACSAERAWQEVQTPALLEHIARPLIRFRFPDGVPPRWDAGHYWATLALFGVIPLGRQRIGIEFPAGADGAYRVRDNGSGAVARTWDHHITIEPLGATQCRYTDRVEVRAGVLTPAVALFAALFYRHRQRRWRQLAATGFRNGGG